MVEMVGLCWFIPMKFQETRLDATKGTMSLIHVTSEHHRCCEDRHAAQDDLSYPIASLRSSWGFHGISDSPKDAILDILTCLKIEGNTTKTHQVDFNVLNRSSRV
jgi:hypothetical protein